VSKQETSDHFVLMLRHILGLIRPYRMSTQAARNSMKRVFSWKIKSLNEFGHAHQFYFLQSDKEVQRYILQ